MPLECMKPIFVEMKNYLATNMKFLRKQKKFSQQKLGDLLGIRRSSIAAYESKGIEPKLSVLVDMARLFSVNIADLVERDLSDHNTVGRGYTENIASNGLHTISPEAIQEFKAKSVRVKKILEGFRIFYGLKLESYDQMDKDVQKFSNDIENFLDVMDYMLDSSKQMLELLRISSNGELEDNIIRMNKSGIEDGEENKNQALRKLGHNLN